MYLRVALRILPSLPLVTAALADLGKLPGTRINRRERALGAMKNREVRRVALKRTEPQRESNQQKKAMVGESTETILESFFKIFLGVI